MVEELNEWDADSKQKISNKNILISNEINEIELEEDVKEKKMTETNISSMFQENSKSGNAPTISQQKFSSDLYNKKDSK